MPNVNITKVYLLNVPLESDYKNTLYFANANDQQAYFQTRIVRSYTDFSYQRKDHVIRIPEEYDDIYHVNYVMYQNTAYSNKWFYAFITELRYVNDGMTEATIETDVMQTWMFDYTIKESFVEREHVNDDTIGLHTYPEGLETGEYIQQLCDPAEYQAMNFLYEKNINSQHHVVLAVTEAGLNLVYPSGYSNRRYNGVYSGLLYLIFPSFADCNKYIAYVQTQIGADNIYSVFMCPYSMVKNETISWITFTDGTTSFQFDYYPFTDQATNIGSVNINKPTVLDKDYTPRNNKLLTYPYVYLGVNNNAGSSAVYRYEDFKELNGDYSSTAKFQIVGAIGEGCSIKLIPTVYKLGNSVPNSNIKIYAEGLDAGKLPTCSWLNDPYVNWLTQNAVNLRLSATQSVSDFFLGSARFVTSGLNDVFDAGGVAQANSGLQGITSLLGEVYAHSKMPQTASGGANQGDLNFANSLSFTPYKYSIRKEYAQIIDKYFDMYGYKIGLVKIPNKNHRSRYWYTKTVDINLNGAIPQNDLRMIKACYNNGITFWRNPSEVEDYSLPNPIV